MLELLIAFVVCVMIFGGRILSVGCWFLSFLMFAIYDFVRKRLLEEQFQPNRCMNTRKKTFEQSANRNLDC